MSGWKHDKADQQLRKLPAGDSFLPLRWHVVYHARFWGSDDDES